ncbi:hypothetical protein F5Y13DRAFT_186517 [Hypoxylon sp. FL1857]|nr:hypothetical protein F5Y13DRAFT_186517 [Hypoxylon sp. FL1857]
MFARLRSEKASSPLRSDSPIRPKTIKHRLFVNDDDYDDEDNEMRPPSPKRHRQGHYSIAPLFDTYRIPRASKEDQALTRLHGRRHRPSPSPEPDHPLVVELDERYATLRATLHSAALSSLRSAESSLIAQSESSIRKNRQKLGTLESQLSKLLTPLQGLTVDYTATGPDGRERTAVVAMRDAITAFEAKLESTAAELDGLWASWTEAQAEIEDLAEEMLSLSGSRNGSSNSTIVDGARRSVGGDMTARGLNGISAAPPYAEALEGFGADLDQASKEVVEEMKTYEERFLKEIEKEAGNILHSFLNR